MEGSGDPHPLAVPPQRYSGQRKEAHKHSKNAKWLSCTTDFDPMRYEKGPSKSNNGTQNRNADETVGGEMGVRVDKLYMRQFCIWMIHAGKGRVLRS